MPDSIYKRDIINFLFIISFPLNGVGSFLSAAVSPNLGSIVGILMYVFILLFHIVDILYKKVYQPKVSINYIIVLFFYVSTVAAFFVALKNNLPETNLLTMIIKSATIVIPFHAFLVVYIYNEKRDNITQLLLLGLSLLLIINLVGFFGLGLSNEKHNIEGRLNLPFVGGLYSGACLIAIINIILFYQIRRSSGTRISGIWRPACFIINLLLFFYINSRLVTLILLFIIVLMILTKKRSFPGVYWVSMFMLPLLLNGGIFIYEVLKLPVFAAIMQRVDMLDVVTFNGRAFIWQSGMDWLLEDQRGLILGNGYKGHYILGILEDIGKFFNVRNLYHLHMHSTTLEIVINQGIAGIVLFFTILFKTYNHFNKQYRLGNREGAFYPVVVFILLVAQVDGFVFLDNLGGLLMAFLAARISLRLQPAIASDAKELSVDHLAQHNKINTLKSLTP